MNLDGTILISIIMPVYNPGEFLDVSLDMLLNQSYKNFELICIDDASTDYSYKILCKYASRDNRIKVYSNAYNCGAALSRNRGLKLAKGEYILFVDADDMFENTLLEKVVEVARKHHPDVVYINYDSFQGYDRPIKDNRSEYYFFSKLLRSYRHIQDYPKEYIFDMQLAPYSKLCKKEFIEKNNLEFQNLKSSNDVYFGLMATFLSKTIAHTLKYENLIHVRNHKSEFRISNNRNPFDNFCAYKFLMKEMQSKGLWENYGTIIQEKFLRCVKFELSTSKTVLAQSYYSFLKNKGLEELQIWDALYSKRLTLTSCEIVNQLKCENYEKMLELYDKTEWFCILLEENEEKVVDLFAKLKKMKKKCAIWGAGKNGSLLTNFCNEKNCYFEGLIDNDTAKIGNSLCGYRIYRPQDMLEKIDIVIILNQCHFNEICDQVSKMSVNVTLVSLELYLRYKMELEESSYMVKSKISYI